MKKTILIAIFSLLIIANVNIYFSFKNSSLDKLQNNLFSSINLSDVIATDGLNKQISSEELKFLFLENIYELLFVDEFRIYVKFSEFLKKAYSKLFFSVGFVLFNFQKVVVSAADFSFRIFYLKRIRNTLSNTFSLYLTYFRTYLKIQKVLPLVLRC